MKKFLFVLCSILLFKVCPMWAQDAGSTRQSTAFGTVELISCTTALRSHAPLYLGLKITPDYGWAIHQVDVKPTTSNQSAIQLFVPFKQPLEDALIYPISSVQTQNTNAPVLFYADGEVTACQGETCVTETIHLARMLSNNLLLVTPECASISLAMANTPIPMHMHALKGWAVQGSDGLAHITIDFERSPKMLQLYDANRQLLDVPFNTNKKRLQFVWPQLAETLKFYARTYYHYYEIELPLLPVGTEIPQFSWYALWDALVASFLFILLSAIPIFWLRITQASLTVFKKQALQMIGIVIGGAALILLCFQMCGPLPLAESIMPKYVAFFLMMLGLLFIPAHPLCVLFFIGIAPRPYLSDLTTLYEQRAFAGISAILLIAAFATQYFFAKPIFKVLQNTKNSSAIWWIARIPWLFLMLYMLIYL